MTHIYIQSLASHWSSILEEHIPNQEPINNLYSTGTLIMLGFDFDQAGTNSAMKRVVVLSVKTEEE